MRVRNRWTVCLAVVAMTVAACGPGDPLPGGDAPGAPGLPVGDLLASPALQEVVELELARDGATLRTLLTDADPAIRARAARAFATLRDLGAAPGLRALLGDADPRVRAAAAFALAHYSGAGDAGDQLTESLATESDPEVRAAFIDALGKAGYSRSLGVLLRLEGDDRAAATLALSRAVVRGAAPAGSVDTLVARLGDPDPVIRRNAAYFMERVENPLVWIDLRQSIRGALDAMALDDPAAMSLVDGLGGRFDVFTLPRIVRRARWASDWRVRANAMAALEGMGDGGQRLQVLLDGLEDPSPHVRARAGESLAGAPPSPDVQAWLQDWVDRHPRDLLALGPVLTLLARAGDEATVLEWVGGLASDEGTAWSLVAVPALSELPGEGAIRALLEASASPDPVVARSAAAALAERIEGARGFVTDREVVELAAEAFTTAAPAVSGRFAVLLADSTLAGAGGAERLRTAAARSGAARLGAAARALGPERSADLLPARAVVERGEGEGEAASVSRDAPAAAVDWAALAALGPRPRLVLETVRGEIVLELAADQAPLTVQRLTELARAGRFDGVPFHRVVPNFVIQGGDLSRVPGGGTAAPRLLSEITPIPFARGVAGMANTGSLDTESSQFFITHDRQPHLDGGYTAFGWVVRGMDVVDRIQPGDRIVRATVVAGTPTAPR